MKIEFGDHQDQYWTPQEHRIIGSDVRFQTHPPIVYIPLNVLRASQAPAVRAAMIKDAIEIREQAGIFVSGIIGGLIGVMRPLAFCFEKLDTETGQTIRDPRIAGIWESEPRKIIHVEGRNLTAEFYRAILGLNDGYDRWLRDQRNPH